MADQAVIVATIYALGTLAAAGTGGFLWRYRDQTGALALVVMMGAMVIWNGSLFFFVRTESAATASVLLRFLYIGVGLVSIAKLAFVFEYTGREHLLRPRVLVPLSIPPILTVFFAFVNPGGLFFATLEPASQGPVAISFTFGPAVLLPIVYGYGINVVLTAMILGFIYRSRAVYRGQSIALLGGTMATWGANAVYVFELVSFDVTAMGSVVSGILFAVAILRYRLLDLMPIARDRVLDNVNDGVFVIDRDDRLIDINPEGRRMLATVGVGTDSLIGRQFPSLFEATELRERYETVADNREETTLEISIGGSDFQIAVTPIDDGRDRHVGWLLIAHDVTERNRREEKLERQNGRLEQFANLVSHDLRNPLNVANGYLELARETDADDEYLAEIEASHDRMEAIIEDVLTMARNGADVTDPEPVVFETLAENAWNGVETGSASVVIDGDVSILADPDRTRRLLENLFRNSIDHGTDGPAGDGLEIRVGTIDADATGATDGFYVEDDGIGIPACRRDRVFEGGYTTDEAGTGFGLSIVDQIATAHGWISEVSESERGGARFEFHGVETPADPSATGPVSGPESEIDSPST